MIIRGSGNVVHLHISIHTTRKVVTINLPVIIAGCGFQSTPPARWWHGWSFKNRADTDFNPHHPQGGDYDMASSGHLFIISIHTTRKVVTISLMNQKGPLSDFNPHHPQGGDPVPAYNGTALKFQSTPPARWWPVSVFITVTLCDFNPHHPQGGDNPDRGGNCINCISIHTTRKVVTHLLLQTQCRLCISIHTTRKVVTGMSWTGTIRSGIFQSTPPARWWRFRRRADSKRDNFNPHHPQGGD